MNPQPAMVGDLVQYDGEWYRLSAIIPQSGEAVLARWEQEQKGVYRWRMHTIEIRVPVAVLGSSTDSPSPGEGSALVEEMRRLRAMPGNCAVANELIDRAIAVQLEAEARTALEAQPQVEATGSAGLCESCRHRAESIARVMRHLSHSVPGMVCDPTPKAECKSHFGYGLKMETKVNCADYVPERSQLQP